MALLQQAHITHWIEGEMSATLRLHREKRVYRDRGRAWKVMVDGAQVAVIQKRPEHQRASAAR